MNLRPYQQGTVEAARRVLAVDRRALIVAPTGAGKTVMLSALCAELPGPVLVLQHRAELLQQNTAALRALSGRSVSTVWSGGADYTAEIISAMQPTLARRLSAFDWRPASIVVDEAHHAAAPSYRRILDHWPDALRLGVTATPNRPDRKPLGPIFGVVAAHIRTAELEDAGYLVPHRVVQVPCVDRLTIDRLPLVGGEYDPAAVAEIYDGDDVTRSIVDAWESESAHERTVVFASTVSHAMHLAAEYTRRGYVAVTVDGTTPDAERRRRFSALAEGRAQVLVNVAVATEGWDCPPVSCVVLARPCSAHATVVQMVGRGKRLHAGKQVCTVIDCGYSLERHPSLEVEPDLWPPKGRAPERACKGCEVSIPQGQPECLYCGHVHTRPCWACGAEIRESDTRCSACGTLQAADTPERKARPVEWVHLRTSRMVADLASCRTGRDGAWALVAVVQSLPTGRWSTVWVESDARYARSVAVEYMGPREQAARDVAWAVLTTRVRPGDLRTIVPGDRQAEWMDRPSYMDPQTTHYQHRTLSRWQLAERDVLTAWRAHVRDYPGATP